MGDENVFITEVGIGRAPPGVVLQQPPLPPKQKLVKSIYDFPSVQNLQVEKGMNLPFRYRVRQPGRAPVWRMTQGKRVPNAGHRMMNHHSIFQNAPSELQAAAAEATRVAGPRATEHVVLPRVEQQKQPNRASNVSRDRSDAAYYKAVQQRHSVSIVGDSVSSVALPVEESCASSSSFTASSHPQPPERLSKLSIARVKKREGLDIPGPPTPDAPVPVPATPVRSVLSSSSAANDYDNLTSVSLRTPQSFAPESSVMSSSRRRQFQQGIHQLAKNLEEEQGHKHQVEEELMSLRKRQQALIDALSPEEREELQAKLKDASV